MKNAGDTLEAAQKAYNNSGGATGLDELITASVAYDTASGY